MTITEQLIMNFQSALSGKKYIAKPHKPEIIKQGSRYGMKLKSKAATTYMIKIDIESTFEPIIHDNI